jgi:hypothetical protein
MLVGYVVPNKAGASMASLRDLLAVRLPAHLVSTALIAMDTLPVDENGKLDLSALPDPAADATTEHAEPSTLSNAPYWRSGRTCSTRRTWEYTTTSSGWAGTPSRPAR